MRRRGLLIDWVLISNASWGLVDIPFIPNMWWESVPTALFWIFFDIHTTETSGTVALSSTTDLWRFIVVEYSGHRFRERYRGRFSCEGWFVWKEIIMLLSTIIWLGCT